MPVHDWTRVSAGTFHDFHLSWIVEIGRVLNTNILTDDYYAMLKRVARSIAPVALTLQATPAEEDLYARKRKRLVIRHSSNDRIVALVEIVSPGNKASRHAFQSFVRKAAGALRKGIHLLAIDLHPPTPRDPQGLHPAICGEFADSSFTLPPDKPLTLASYAAEGPLKRAFIESVAVGDPLPSMPLFLTPEAHVLVPLEATYRTAFDAVPRRWREVL